MGEITSGSIQMGLTTPTILRDAYISTGTSELPYIDDNTFALKSSHGLKLTFQYIGETPPSSNFAHIISSTTSGGSKNGINITLTSYNSSTGKAVLEISYGGRSSITASIDLYSKHTLEIVNSSGTCSVIIDGTTLGNTFSMTYIGGGLRFFGKYGNSQTSARQCYVDFYGLEVKEGNNVVYNYIPAQNGTLHETVSDRVLSNDGTGTITYVPPVYEDTVESNIIRINQAKSDIKTAIEAKGVTVGNGTIDTYAAKVAQIPTGGSANLQTKSVDLSSAFTTTITPDQGYDGMSSVTVDPKIQTYKNVTTAQSSVQVSPDSGYNGMAGCSVTFTGGGGGNDYNAFKVSSMNDSILNNSVDGDFATLYKTTSPRDFAFKQHHVGTTYTQTSLEASSPPSLLNDVVTSEFGFSIPSDSSLENVNGKYLLYQNQQNESLEIKLDYTYGTGGTYTITVKSSNGNYTYLWNIQDDGMMCMFETDTSYDSPGNTITFGNDLSVNNNADWNTLSYYGGELIGQSLFYMETVSYDYWSDLPILDWADNAYSSDIKQGKKAYTNNGIITGTYVPPSVNALNGVILTTYNISPSLLPSGVPDGTVALPLGIEGRSSRIEDMAGTIFMDEVTFTSQPTAVSWASMNSEYGQETLELQWNIDSTSATIEIRQTDGAMATLVDIEYTSNDGLTYTLSYTDIDYKIMNKYPYILSGALYGASFDLYSDNDFEAMQEFVARSGYMTSMGLWVYNATLQQWVSVGGY